MKKDKKSPPAALSTFSEKQENNLDIILKETLGLLDPSSELPDQERQQLTRAITQAYQNETLLAQSSYPRSLAALAVSIGVLLARPFNSPIIDHLKLFMMFNFNFSWMHVFTRWLLPTAKIYSIPTLRPEFLMTYRARYCNEKDFKTSLAEEILKLNQDFFGLYSLSLVQHLVRFTISLPISLILFFLIEFLNCSEPLLWIAHTINQTLCLFYWKAPMPLSFLPNSSYEKLFTQPRTKASEITRQQWITQTIEKIIHTQGEPLLDAQGKTVSTFTLKGLLGQIYCLLENRLIIQQNYLMMLISSAISCCFVLIFALTHPIQFREMLLLNALSSGGTQLLISATASQFLFLSPKTPQDLFNYFFNLNPPNFNQLVLFKNKLSEGLKWGKSLRESTFGLTMTCLGFQCLLWPLFSYLQMTSQVNYALTSLAVSYSIVRWKVQSFKNQFDRALQPDQESKTTKKEVQTENSTPPPDFSRLDAMRERFQKHPESTHQKKYAALVLLTLHEKNKRAQHVIRDFSQEIS